MFLCMRTLKQQNLRLKFDAISPNSSYAQMSCMHELGKAYWEFLTHIRLEEMRADERNENEREERKWEKKISISFSLFSLI